MESKSNLSNGMIRVGVLAILVTLMSGCSSKIEGKIFKKEVEPERTWKELRIVYPMRCLPQKSEYLLIDNIDFVFYVSRVDGKTDRFYTSERAFETYKIGDKIVYNPFLINTRDIIEREIKMGKK